MRKLAFTRRALQLSASFMLVLPLGACFVDVNGSAHVDALVPSTPEPPGDKDAGDGPVVADSGTAPDAGPAQPAPNDAGAPPADAATPVVDGGPTPDASTPADAGATDAGTPTMDASPPDVDSGPACPDNSSQLERGCGFRFRLELSVPPGAVQDELDGFPVPVMLDPQRVDYNDIAPNAADVQFLSADGITRLAHEVEHWDPTGESVIWVRMPTIAPAGTQFWMVYGNPDADLPDTSAQVWTAGYVGVWHMNSIEETRTGDSTGSHAARTAGGMTPVNEVEGVVGGAINFDGFNDAIYIDDLSLDGFEAITLEAWVLQPNGGDDRVICQAEGTAVPDHTACIGVADGTVRIRLRSGDEGEVFGNYERELDEPAQWTHLAFSWAGRYDRMVLYENGERIGDFTHGGDRLQSNVSVLALGNVTETDDRFLDGRLDEVRVSTVPRPRAWMRAQVDSADPNWLDYAPVAPIQ